MGVGGVVLMQAWGHTCECAKEEAAWGQKLETEPPGLGLGLPLQKEEGRDSGG